jgi:ABC-type polysaccharide/polyol phosphate export permease
MTATDRRGAAQSGELWWTLVHRGLLLRSKRTVIGTWWPIVSPLLLFALYAFVFNSVFKVPVKHYGIFLFAGLLPWSFLAQAVGLATGALTTEPDLIRRAPFHYEILPLSMVGTMAVYFTATLMMFVGYLAVRGFIEWPLVLLLPIPVVSLVLFVGGLTMILSMIDVYTRDLRLLLGNAMTVWFFLVPVVYRPSMAHGWLRRLRSIDPMNMIIGQFRNILYDGHLYQPMHMVAMVVVCTVFFLGCLTLFRHFAPNLPRDI